MSEYRDALVTAKERLVRLEALAKERGLPRRSDRGKRMALGTVIVAVVCAGIYVALRSWSGDGRSESVVVEKKAPPPPSAPTPPRDLEWYEPDDSWNPNAGPREAWLAGKHLIVGLLWLRGERRNGLYAGAFDYDSLAKLWVAGPFDSEWTGEEDERFHIAVSGESSTI